VDIKVVDDKYHEEKLLDRRVNKGLIVIYIKDCTFWHIKVNVCAYDNCF
jgi:hypothetical protein